MTYPNTPGYVKTSDTSRTAAQSIDAKTMRGIALEAIKRSGVKGMTCDELELTLGMRHQTASARLSELCRKGDIVDGGDRRLTRSGRPAAVYMWADLYLALTQPQE